MINATKLFHVNKIQAIKDMIEVFNLETLLAQVNNLFEVY